MHAEPVSLAVRQRVKSVTRTSLPSTLAPHAVRLDDDGTSSDLEAVASSAAVVFRMEDKFSHDFSRVRVSAPDARAERLAWDFARGQALSKPELFRAATVPAPTPAVPGSSGRALAPTERADFEQRLGVDLSPVRIHADEAAARFARSLGAEAATVGSRIYFGAGRFAPFATDGQCLLAHELAHTVQLESRHIAHRAGATDVVDAHVSWWNNLDEAALGRELLQRVRRGAFTSVQAIFDELSSTDRDDVAKELLEAAADGDIVAMVLTEPGRALADRLFDELTSGRAAPEEQAQADRILSVKAARMAPGAFHAAALTAKVFPYRLPGLTVFYDSPILAERRPNGRIWVKLPARVWGSGMFQDETKTLPEQVFTGGMEIPADEVVGIRFYDLGGILVYRPALILVQLANETDTNALTKIAEITGIGLTLGTGALVGLGVEATLAARVLLWADRVAFVLGTLAAGINEHRGEIIAAYGDDGRAFLKAVDIVQSLTAIYGFARVALTVPQAVTRLRDVYMRIRSSAQGPVTMVAKDVDEVLARADDIAAVRRPDPGGGGTSASAVRRDGATVPTDRLPEPAAAPEVAPTAPTRGHTAEGVGADFTHSPYPAGSPNTRVQKGHAPSQTESAKLESYADALRNPKSGPATSAAGSPETGAYIRENLYVRGSQSRVTEGLERAGVLRRTTNSVEIVQPEAYVKWLERSYRRHGGAPMDPRMKDAIRKYVSRTDKLPSVGVDPASGGTSFGGSLPGTHAEVQAMNDALVAGKGGLINVVVLRSKAGGHFPACVHCRGILEELQRAVPEFRVLSGLAQP